MITKRIGVVGFGRVTALDLAGPSKFLRPQLWTRVREVASRTMR
jgi:hypothetical protein